MTERAFADENIRLNRPQLLERGAEKRHPIGVIRQGVIVSICVLSGGRSGAEGGRDDVVVRWNDAVRYWGEISVSHNGEVG